MSVRRGLFGGTFDPPHVGHVAALRAAVATGRFDVVEVTVAGDPYAKRHRSLHSAEERLAMAHAAFDPLDGVVVSDRELRRAGPSFTIDTVREILEEVAAVDLLIGADLTSQLPTWHDAAALAALVEVAVVPRPGSTTTLPPGWRGYEIPMEPVDLSSTFLQSLDSGADVSKFVPAAVIPLWTRTSE